MSDKAKIQIWDLIVEMMANGVRTGVLTQVEALAACSDACAAISIPRDQQPIPFQSARETA
ncbi:hypothetical protein RLPCCGM1_c1306 [Rhizobium leguminosarum bv. phaseoli CCGM1]|uniref:hypothetical protein n=1 Tax=Rhizobium phaseoli TaxID=396 RepID=UPI0004DA949A|nr:hypothetical protein [Rhizobium phaseoli]KEC73190.1 hypothetical protein RLPCCGM1_c1306 [Rhizobium leguminosarum bv. phaseoli CCGM1]PWI54158.1 hypothetical protein B5K03_12005 [Rhizobium phaseoli]